MLWGLRERHGAATCDVCGKRLPPVAWGRRPIHADYSPRGVLREQAERIGLLLACGDDCAMIADSIRHPVTLTRIRRGE